MNNSNCIPNIHAKITLIGRAHNAIWTPLPNEIPIDNTPLFLIAKKIAEKCSAALPTIGIIIPDKKYLLNPNVLAESLIVVTQYLDIN